ncbi:hypothetical protein [Geminisphaera colitermitum]|uniref:hypothetical protein n=1 Tax=Geminisphaera colitermitum TaxID=1148786 RepID=UPI000158CEC8|nr:hypothetical protein [Geminisphaera colitermitum]
MSLQLFSDTLDDDPATAACDGFVGADFATKPNLLAEGIVRAGENVWMDADRMVNTRPGLRMVSLLLENNEPLPADDEEMRIQGMGYYDTPDIERLIVARGGKLYAIHSDDAAALWTLLEGAPEIAPGPVRFCQMVDRLYYLDGAGVLRWCALIVNTWEHGTITKFSNGTDMPAWQFLCAHQFRLCLVQRGGHRMYVSAVGQASAEADWIVTDNVRVGTGEGDPIRSLVSAMGGGLGVFCAGSVWSIDSSDPVVGNWSIMKVTDIAGCAEGNTVVAVGQDIYFLSQWGVCSLGALQTTDSISPASTISAPIQPFLDRINWSQIRNAWATVWGDLYLLALPLDEDTLPIKIFPFHLRTKTWMCPWTAKLAPLLLREEPTGPLALETEAGEFLIDEAGPAPVGNVLADETTGTQGAVDLIPFRGFSCGIISRFGGLSETIIGDSNGRVFLLDPSWEKDDSLPNRSQEIPSWVTTKSLDFEFPSHLKQPFWMQVLFFKSTARGVQLNLVRDGLLSWPDTALEECEKIERFETMGGAAFFPITFPIHFQRTSSFEVKRHIRDMPRFLECGLQIHCARGRLRLRSVRFATFLDTPELL